MLRYDGREKFDNAPVYVNSVTHSSLFPDDQVYVDSSVDSEVGDFLDNAGGAVDVDDSLVNAHFIVIVRVGTISARGASSHNGEHFGGNADCANSLVTLCLGATDDLSTGVFEGLGFATTKSHSNSLVFFSDFFTLGLVLFSVHFS